MNIIIYNQYPFSVKITLSEKETLLQAAQFFASLFFFVLIWPALYMYNGNVSPTTQISL